MLGSEYNHLLKQYETLEDWTEDAHIRLQMMRGILDRARPILLERAPEFLGSLTPEEQSIFLDPFVVLETPI